MFKPGDRIYTTTDGAVGTVKVKNNTYGRIHYRVEWDTPRFGMKASNVGPGVMALVSDKEQAELDRWNSEQEMRHGTQ